MSKLDDMLWPQPFKETGKPLTVVVQGPIPFRGAQKIYQRSYSMTKQQIKDLMLELIGEEELATFNELTYRRFEKGGRNDLRAELRKKVEEL